MPMPILEPEARLDGVADDVGSGVSVGGDKDEGADVDCVVVCGSGIDVLE